MESENLHYNETKNDETQKVMNDVEVKVKVKSDVTANSDPKK